jgi:hypothetical protein
MRFSFVHIIFSSPYDSKESKIDNLHKIRMVSSKNDTYLGRNREDGRDVCALRSFCLPE